MVICVWAMLLSFVCTPGSLQRFGNLMKNTLEFWKIHLVDSLVFPISSLCRSGDLRRNTPLEAWSMLCLVYAVSLCYFSVILIDVALFDWVLFALTEDVLLHCRVDVYEGGKLPYPHNHMTV